MLQCFIEDFNVILCNRCVETLSSVYFKSFNWLAPALVETASILQVYNIHVKFCMCDLKMLRTWKYSALQTSMQVVYIGLPYYLEGCTQVG